MHQELRLTAMHKTPDLTQEIMVQCSKMYMKVVKIVVMYNGFQMVIVCTIIPIMFVNCHVDIHTNAMFVINYIQQANVGMEVVIKIILI